MLIRLLSAVVPGHARKDSRTAEPITVGVPLPRGLVVDPPRWTLASGSAGAPMRRPVQARVVDRWADGSARWVLVDGQIDVDAGMAGVIQLERDDATAS